MRPRTWIIIGLTLCLGVAGLMTLHTVRHALRMHHDSGRLRPWMSIPYIARTRHVPADVLYDAAGLPNDKRDRRPLGRIARQQHRPLDELIASVEAAVVHARSQGSPRLPGRAP